MSPRQQRRPWLSRWPKALGAPVWAGAMGAPGLAPEPGLAQQHQQSLSWPCCIPTAPGSSAGGGGKLHCTSEYVKAGEAARGEGNPNAPDPPELGQTVQRNLCKNETKGLETTPETPQAALINTRAGCSWREAGQPSLTAPGAPSAAMRLLVLQCWRQLSGNAEGMCFRVNFAPVYCVSSEKGCTKLGPG